MGYKDEKIDYTGFLRGKPQETDPVKLASMKGTLVKALKERGVHGRVSVAYYADGNVLVRLDGDYYGVFDSNKGEFFGGYVGDYKHLTDI